MTGAIAVVTAGQVRLAGVLAQEDGEPVEEEHVEHEAENAFLPETTEIIWHTIAFVVIAALLLKFGLPAAKNMAKARTERIAAEMGAAEAAKRDAAEAAAQVKAQLADAENEHLRVVEEARRTAEALRNEQLVRLREEVADTRARALEDIEASKTRAIQELHASLARLAVAAAEDTVRRALDDQTRVALVDQFIEELSTSGTGARA